jgi:hypothetical protein
MALGRYQGDQSWLRAFECGVLLTSSTARIIHETRQSITGGSREPRSITGLTCATV